MDEEKTQILPKFVDKGATYARSTVDSKGGSNSFSRGGNIASLLSNIDDGITPFQKSDDDISVEDVVRLCQKAYWNISIFRLTIDVLTEFANSRLHFHGKNKSSVEFFEKWYKKVGGWDFAEQFFREMFRSSNMFVYRLKGSMRDYPSNAAPSKSGKMDARIPILYTLINPTDMRCSASASFVDGRYKKILNEYEISVLRESKDPKDRAVFNSLPADAKKQITEKKGRQISVSLDPDNFRAIFYKKQDYEPFAMPMYFPVLFDLNLKLELKKAESVVARTTDYIILLITMGDKENGVDPVLHDAMQGLFAEESVGRVMVSDYTTEMDFVIPDLNKILGPEKYEAVNADIANGLMNIFFSEQKYADSMVKIKIFLERLKEARTKYLKGFLIPEMEEICEELGFTECPVPHFEDIDLKDEVEYFKIYNRLAELGFLTADELFEAHKTHHLPEVYDSLVAQEKFKKQKDDGLYAPAGQEEKDDEVAKPAGRPTGGKQKQKKKKVTPVGASKQFSVMNLKDSVQAADKLNDKVCAEYKELHGIKRLSKKHREMASSIAWAIVQNERKEHWEESIPSYLANPLKIGAANDDVFKLAETHRLDTLSAALLLNSEMKNV